MSLYNKLKTEESAELLLHNMAIKTAEIRNSNPCKLREVPPLFSCGDNSEPFRDDTLCSCAFCIETDEAESACRNHYMRKIWKATPKRKEIVDWLMDNTTGENS